MGGRGRNSDRYYLHEGNHGKHVVGHNNYQDDGRSVITISKERLIELFEKYRGTGTKIGDYRERVNFNEIIGIYKSKESGQSEDTTMGIIHCKEDNGWHIIPAKPIKEN